MKRLAFCLFMFLTLSVSLNAQLVRIRNFEGQNIARKLTNAENFGCNSNTNVTCVLWIEPDLSVFTNGNYTGPTRINTYIRDERISTGSIGNSYNVQTYGAKCDGVTDDSQAFLNAVTAAGTGGRGIYVPFTGNQCRLSSTLTLTRITRITCAPGVELRWTSATGTMLIFATASDPDWIAGGIDLCNLTGNNGASDTSVALQLGSGTQSAQGLLFRGFRVRNFGNGVVYSGNGSNFATLFDGVKLHNNACNGIRFDTTAAPEVPTFANGMIFNNGLATATCTGVHAPAGSNAAMRFTNTHFDNNGDGTLGQVHSASNVPAEWYFTNDHFEKAGGAASMDITCLAQGGPNCAIRVTDTNFSVNPAGNTTILPTIRIAAGILLVENSSITYQAGASLTPIFDIGASVGGNGLWITLRNNSLTCSNTSANCQVISISGTASLTNFDVVGTTLSGFGSSSFLANFAAGSKGCHDLLSLVNNGGPSGSRNCTGDNLSKRFFLRNATSLVAADFALSAGWGTTATVSSVAGKDFSFRVVIASSGTGQAASPTVTLTYKDLTATNAPNFVCTRGDLNAPTGQAFATGTTATTFTFTASITPTAGTSYTFSCVGSPW